MEIDITNFVKNAETWDFSGSIATHGPNAAKNTWNNAKREAATSPLLTTEEQLQALRDHVQSMGFGDEVQTYPADECNVLFIQLISGDMRENGMEDCDIDDFDWSAYQERIQEGQISGNIFICDIPDHEHFGHIFYCLEG